MAGSWSESGVAIAISLGTDQVGPSGSMGFGSWRVFCSVVEVMAGITKSCSFKRCWKKYWAYVSGAYLRMEPISAVKIHECGHLNEQSEGHLHVFLCIFMHRLSLSPKGYILCVTLIMFSKQLKKKD